MRRASLDWAAPILIAGFGVVHISLDSHTRDYPGSPARHLAFVVAAALVLGLRRQAPAAAPLTAIALASAWGATYPQQDQGPFEGFVILVGAAYCIGFGLQGRSLRLATSVIVAAFAASQVFLVLAGGGGLGDLVPLIVWVGTGWAVGVVLSRRTQQTAQARAQAATLAEEHELATARAVEEERSRIARELHDVVAHALSVIVVQAAAERRSLSGGSVDPATAESVLGSVERLGREALVDLRRLLGLLRATGEPPALAPQPSLAQLDGLVDQVRGTGIDVRVSADRSVTALPAGLGLTAYRIVQEALTNVVKHAHASVVEIVVEERAHALTIEVRDDGTPSPRDGTTSPLPSGGHGLVGMHERATVFGGAVTAGPSEQGGWVVAASLPIDRAAVGVG